MSRDDEFPGIFSFSGTNSSFKDRRQDESADLWFNEFLFTNKLWTVIEKDSNRGRSNDFLMQIISAFLLNSA